MRLGFASFARRFSWTSLALATGLSACGGRVATSDEAAFGQGSSDAGAASSSSSSSASVAACGDALVSANAPKTLDQSFGGYHGLATDGAYLYYTSALDGVLVRQPVGGGDPEHVADVPYLRNVKGHGDRVCWMSPAQIACRKADGPIYVVVQRTWNGDDWSQMRDFDFDDANAYWLDENSISRAPIGGGGSESIFVAGEDTTRTIALAADHVVWATDTVTAIRSCPKESCGTPSELTRFGPPPASIVGGLAGDDGFVYVPVHLADANGRRGGRLVKIDPAGGPVLDLIACLDESPVDVKVDGTTAFFLTNAGTASDDPDVHTEGGSVYLVPLDGSTPRRVATNQEYPAHVAFTASTFFWMNEYEREGQLQSLPR